MYNFNVWRAARGQRCETFGLKYLSLQALRAFAAIMVVVYHSQALCHKYAAGPSTTEAILGEFGSHGVDLFFILSGFVIFLTLRKTDSTPGRFLSRRLIRIVPLYWLLTLCMMTFGVLVSPKTPVAVRPVLESLLFSSYVLNARMPVIYVGWSLEYEVFFYLVVTLALLAAVPLYRAVGLTFLTLYTGLHLLLPFASAAGNPGYFLGSPLLFEFVIGLLLAELALNRSMSLLDWTIPLAAVGLSIAVQGMTRLVWAGLPAAVLVWAAIKAEHWTNRYKVMHFLAKVGDSSYSIYLVQVMMLPGVGKLAARFLPHLPADFLVLIAVTLTVAAGMLIHRGIERPLLISLQTLLCDEPRNAAA
jgi:exopolysaccharide production protein ExoZ